MKKFFTCLLLGMAALVLTACGTKKTELYPLKVAYSPYLCNVPLHVAIEKGFFEAEGVKPEAIQIDAAHVQEAIGANQVDLGMGLVNKFLIPMENGLPVKFIAGIHSGCNKVLTKKDSGIKKIADLKGKKLGVAGLADATALLTRRALAEQGISTDEKNPEVQLIVYSRNDLPQALEKGLVDAIALADPIATIAEEEQKLHVLLDSSVTPPYDKEYCCAIYITGKLAKEHPEIAAAVTRAVMKASAWVQAHPDEAAKLQLEKKYVSGDLAFNKRVLKSYNYHPSIKGGYDAVLENAVAFAKIGILKKVKDPKAFADQFYLQQKDLPDSYSAADVANVK